jgi:hypothetical protein
VVNAMATSGAIVPKFGSDTAGRYYKDPTGNSMLSVAYGSSRLYSPVAGEVSFLAVPVSDTLLNIFNGKLDLESGGIYSFFLSGDTDHADTLMVTDNIPSYSDSSAGVRFVNLSVGGKAIVVNIAGDSGNFQFPAIGYQGVTDFKKYAATASAGTSYKFEVRDQASGALLGTYNWPYVRYKNQTVVVSGDPTIPAQFKVFAVNNY